MFDCRLSRLTVLGGIGIYSVGWLATACCTERELTMTNFKEKK
jgi:hypothetical protein